MMSLLIAFGKASAYVVALVAFLAILTRILTRIPGWASAAVALLLTLILPALYIAFGLWLPFPWDLAAFAVAAVLIWWRVWPELRALIACIRRPVGPAAIAPVVAARSPRELRLTRREIAIDCVLLIWMFTFGTYFTELDGDLRLALVAAGFAAFIVNGLIHARLKDRAQSAAGVVMDLMLSDRTTHGAAESDLIGIEHEPDFAILSDGNTFIQCRAPGVGPDRSRYGYLLEYQDGSEEEHYRAIDEPITLARVLSAFRKYLRGDASFRTDLLWRKVELERWNPGAGQTQVGTEASTD
jgi:hypothetical protein